MPLGLVPEVLDAIGMPSLGIDQFLFVVDSFVLVSLNGRGVVSTLGIRKDTTGWKNLPAGTN
jgi:hypothetical protein